MKNLSFHGDDVVPAPPEEALFHVIPVPYEHSVSYGSGTGQGPAAILEASAQLETLTLGVVPAEYGIHTTAPVDCVGGVEQVLERIGQEVEKSLTLGKIPVVLGGEHTVTCGVIASLKEHFGSFGVIQFDAHADLRDEYGGSPYSHACVMRRIHEQAIPIYQLGTRSYSIEERDYREQHNIAFQDGVDIWKNGAALCLPEDFPEKVYITFDIDGLDSAIMPATGTPVPGGIDWFGAMSLIEQIMESRVCVGFDVVEFAPIAGFHGYSFATAQLVYNMMAFLARSGPSRT